MQHNFMKIYFKEFLIRLGKLSWEIHLTKIKLNSSPFWIKIFNLYVYYVSELDRIIRIIRYSNSWDRIVLFVFGIRSICDFRIIFEYPNSCHRIPNIFRIFSKQDMCRKHSKKSSCRYENKGSNFPHLIWSQISHIKFFGGLLIDFKYSVFE